MQNQIDWTSLIRDHECEHNSSGNKYQYDVHVRLPR